MIGFHHQKELGRQLVNDVSKYFPVAGRSLNNSIRGFKQTGPALIIGLLITFYGARGGGRRLPARRLPYLARPQTRPQWLSAQP